jgi:hypothetical protein
MLQLDPLQSPLPTLVCIPSFQRFCPPASLLQPSQDSKGSNFKGDSLFASTQRAKVPGNLGSPGAQYQWLASLQVVQILLCNLYCRAPLWIMLRLGLHLKSHSASASAPSLCCSSKNWSLWPYLTAREKHSLWKPCSLLPGNALFRTTPLSPSHYLSAWPFLRDLITKRNWFSLLGVPMI